MSLFFCKSQMELGDIKQVLVAFLGAGFAHPAGWEWGRFSMWMLAGIEVLPSKDPRGEAGDSITDVPGPRMPGQGNATM